jgi:predicted permease
MWLELRGILRSLSRARGIAVSLTMLLALGITAAAVCFSLVHQLLLRPAPYERPGRLIRLRSTSPNGSAGFSNPAYLAIRSQCGTIAGLAAYWNSTIVLTEGGASERVGLELVSDNYHAVLGVKPHLGHLFADGEAGSLGGQAVILGYDFWRKRFAADPMIVGRKLLLNGHPFEVIGVLAPDFRSVDSGLPPALQALIPARRLFTPDGFDPLSQPYAMWLTLIARLCDGCTVEQARAEIGAAHQAIMEPLRLPGKFSLLVEPLASFHPTIRERFGKPVSIAFAFVAFALLVASSSVALVFVARQAARRREILMRQALGASPRHIVAGAIAEPVILGAASGLAALFLYRPLCRMTLFLFPLEDSQYLLSDALTWPVAAFIAGAAFLLIVLLGVLSVVDLRSVSLGFVTRPGPFTTPASRRLRDGLIVAQLIVSIVLIGTSFSFARSFRNAAAAAAVFSVPPGSVVLFTVDPGAAGYDYARSVQFLTLALARTREQNVVDSASVSVSAPFRVTPSAISVCVEGQNVSGGMSPPIDISPISDGYFATFGIPVVEGRHLDPFDTASGRKVAIVNETFARSVAGNRAIGRSLRIGCGGPPFEIIGIVKAARFENFWEPEPPLVYFPFSSEDQGNLRFLLAVRSSDPGAARALVTGLLRDLDRNVPLYDIRTWEESISRSLDKERALAVISGFLSVVTLALAALGVYGSASALVVNRSLEIGVRIALGATPTHAAKLVIAHILALALLGTVLGLAAYSGIAQILRSLLYGVSPTDPASLASTCLALFTASLLAAAPPAFRAARLDLAPLLRRA